MAVSIPRSVGRQALLALLADGRMHSGEGLARALGVSRAAVWKTVERLRGRGIDVQSLARRGYRLEQPTEMLDASRIRDAIGAQRERLLCGFELLFEVDSTNTRLLSGAPPPGGAANVCFAELQHAGRGRRGRPWVSPFGASIAMSVGWSFRDVVRDLPALSLAVGVAVARALARVGAQGIGLKWPNDIWFEDRKLGGVLLELRAEAGGPAFVVIGVGINLALSGAARRAIESGGVRAAAVADACRDPPSRNRVAGAILDELLSMLVQFEHDGFAPFRAEWTALDVLQGREARVVSGPHSVVGRARGVDFDGALLLEVDGERRRFNSGEASLRLEGESA